MSSENHRLIQVMVKCLKDEPVAGHAIVALGRLEAIDELKPFLQPSETLDSQCSRTGIVGNLKSEMSEG